MNSPYMGKFRISQLYKGAAHDGLDLVGVDSKTIHSTVNGVVLHAGWENSRDHRQGFGQYVKIRRTGTREVYYFGHLSSLLVKAGDRVEITDPIGIEGSTGRSTGSHLHYCMRLGGVKGQHQDINRISGIPNVIGVYDDGYVSRMDTLGEQAEQLSLSVGDRVRVRQGAADYNGRRLASFVYRTVYDVQQVSGSRIVIGIGGQVTAAVHAADLTRMV